MYIYLSSSPPLCVVWHPSACGGRHVCAVVGCEVSCARADICLSFDSTCLDCTFTSKKKSPQMYSISREKGEQERGGGGE